MDLACAMCASRHSVCDGRGIKVELNVRTLADWMQQFSDGLLETHVENSGQGTNVPGNAAQGDDAEGFDMGMAIEGASHHDRRGAVFGSEGSATESGVNDERTRVNQPAGLSMKAAGQTRHQISTSTERFLSWWTKPG